MRFAILLLLIALLVMPAVALGVLAGPGALNLEPPKTTDQPAAPAGTAKEDPVSKPEQKTTPAYSRSGYDITPYSRERVAELAKKLDPETYRITQKAGTEPAFCGTLLDNKKDGTYCCVVCGLPLFSSSHKFNSGTGWPSFFAPFDIAHVAAREDNSHGMQRIEINCARCDAHLGHVFDDGPRPTGLRFCLNGAALTFHEKGASLPSESQPVATETAYFAGGCFWGIEHYFQQAPGVVSAESGYMQGSSEKPDYKEICSQDDVPASRRPEGYRPHAEAVKVVFDPKAISYRDLLRGFFEMHDPTQLNRQGPDYGTQYRSGVYTVGDAQLAEAKAFVAELAAKSAFAGRKIVTEVEPAKPFTSAEAYHQDYLEKNPERGCHIGKPWWVATKSPAAAAPGR
jgi:peptide methionine sulfoxide reductase msrA/msrB